jgi:hypothetical protein
LFKELLLLSPLSQESYPLCILPPPKKNIKKHHGIHQTVFEILLLALTLIQALEGIFDSQQFEQQL